MKISFSLPIPYKSLTFEIAFIIVLYEPLCLKAQKKETPMLFALVLLFHALNFDYFSCYVKQITLCCMKHL